MGLDGLGIAYLGCWHIGGEQHLVSREHDLAVCTQGPAPPVRRQVAKGPAGTCVATAGQVDIQLQYGVVRDQ
jgi:hypothetical protein